MSHKIVQVDSFADRPFTGNPAAVCVLDAPAETEWMQSVALEMNLSETAFLVRRGDDSFDLRWFTPAVEVDLCGHATLASAHVLWEDGHLAKDEPARFHTRSGQLGAVLRGEWIEMDFPAALPEACTAPDGLNEALGAKVLWTGANRDDLFVELDNEATVRGLSPDLSALGRIPHRGVIVTATSADAEIDFVSRFFGPAVGVPEDPVTGSAHCGLGPFWTERLGKSELTGYQASARGGIVRVLTRGERVDLLGQAITVLRAELLI